MNCCEDRTSSEAVCVQCCAGAGDSWSTHHNSKFSARRFANNAMLYDQPWENTATRVAEANFSTQKK